MQRVKSLGNAVVVVLEPICHKQRFSVHTFDDIQKYQRVYGDD